MDKDLTMSVLRKKNTKSYSGAVKLKGIIELCHGRKVVISEKFISRYDRNVIIQKWKSNYQLQNKRDISFIIRYL
jgi:hypothetical protein